MKKLFTLVMLAGFALASCNGGGEEQTTTETQTVQDTVTVVEESQVEIEREVSVDTTESEVVDTLSVE